MRFFRLMLPLAAAATVLAACGSSSSGPGAPTFPSFGPPGSQQQQCTGTQVQLANPTPYQTGVSANTNVITIVANGNSNALGQTYGNWFLVLQGQFGPGDQIQGSFLQPADGHTLTHPYGSDYYYSSTLASPLNSGDTYNVTLEDNNSGCQVPVQSFGT